MSSTTLPNEFETQLRIVVTAKRLSSSKMTALTDLAVENMQSDTEMISLMYRFHKSLPGPNKVSSLYVFDSIARAAHRHKSKNALVADLNSSVGNAATFLLRLEGVLDGLVEDMLAHGPPEAKEKTRKVLDIWTREGTFPAGTLTRLTERVKGNSYSQGATNTRPPVINTAVPQADTPVATPNGIATLPPAILALLGSAVSPPVAAQPALPVQVSPPPPPAPQFTLDPTQLALISQLTAAHGTPPPPRPPAQSPPHLADQRQASSNGDYHSPRSRSRSRSPSRWRERDPRFRNERGERFRDDERRPRYRDDRPPRFRDDERGPPLRFRDDPPPRAPPREDPRKRRSRSPRASLNGGSGRAPLPGAGEVGKDEFGRDVRSASPGSDQARPVDAVPAPVSNDVSPSVVDVSPLPTGEAGLGGFDMASFNPADPTAWMKLAAAWQHTNGRPPTQEEMMMFIAGGGVMAAPGTNDMVTDQWDQSGYNGSGRGRGRGNWQPRGGGFRGRGRGRGRGAGGGGGFGGYNEGGGGGEYGAGGGEYGVFGMGGDSDAIVLGGGDSDAYDHNAQNGNGYGDAMHNAEGGYGAPVQAAASAASPSSGGGGGMKRVDGKWVWSKN